MKATIAIAAIAAALAAQAVEVDGIAAQVGADAILKSEVEGEMTRIGATFKGDYNATLNRLIERKLIVKAAGDAKMTMQEWVVDNRVREIVDSGFNGDRNELIAALAREKMPYTEFRQRIKDDLIVGAMRWNTIDKFVAASPSEMREEYNSHPERYVRDDTTSVGVILLSPGEEAKREKVMEMISEKSFAQAAKLYSADTHAKDGGLWKDIRPADVFRPEICKAIEELKVGETSDWIDLGGWSFLLKKESESKSEPKSFLEAYDDIEDNVKSAKAKEMYDRWLDLLKAETYIKVY